MSVRSQARTCGPHRDEDAGVLWVDSGSASIFENPVLWTRPVSPAEAGKMVRRQTEALSQRSGAPYRLYRAFPPPDLSEYGLQPAGHPPCSWPQTTVNRCTALWGSER